MDRDLTPNEAAALEELVWELSAPHTQEAIADRLGMSQQGIAVVEKRALVKLRRLMSGSAWEDGLKEPPKNHTNAEFGCSDGRTPNRIPE